jgi:hypothetical protein
MTGSACGRPAARTSCAPSVARRASGSRPRIGCANGFQKRICATFGRHLGRDVAQALLAEADPARLDGEEREVVVLFSYLQSYSTLSEHLTLAGRRRSARGIGFGRSSGLGGCRRRAPGSPGLSGATRGRTRWGRTRSYRSPEAPPRAIVRSDPAPVVSPALAPSALLSLGPHPWQPSNAAPQRAHGGARSLRARCGVPRLCGRA